MAEAIELLVGKIARLEFKEPDKTDRELWDKAWEVKIEALRRHNPTIADYFEGYRGFYDYALGVAKGYFDKPYGGDRASSGQYGSILIRPQDFAYMLPNAKKYNAWTKTVTTGWGNLFGDATDPIKASTVSEKRSLLAFHGFVSYRPTPRIQQLLLNVNRFPYVVNVVEIISKTPKLHTVIKFIPLSAPIIIHPGGEFYVRAAFDSAGEIEVAPLGFCFAEFDYLKQELWF